jgi:hypothetical protein
MVENTSVLHLPLQTSFLLHISLIMKSKKERKRRKPGRLLAGSVWGVTLLKIFLVEFMRAYHTAFLFSIKKK